MEKETQVKQIQIRERRTRLQPTVLKEMEQVSSAEWAELPQREKGWRAFVSPEALTKNLALLGCLSLVVLALQTAGAGEDGVTVFSSLQSGLTAAWEEDIGKLSFVSELLPPEIREVWNPTPVVAVTAPLAGDTVHTWSAKEPYLEIASTVSDVRAAAAGEVMSIAHGPEEERILRLRHTDGSESLYGNLAECFVEVGDSVESGEVIAALLAEKPLAFELRLDGRSVDPASVMRPIGE